jgi:hypothetical protein
MRARQWLRDHANAVSAAISTVQPEDAKALAAELRRLRDSGEMSDATFDRMCKMLWYRGPDGTTWTIDPKALAFMQLSGSDLVAADQPKFLFLDGRTMAALRELSQFLGQST